MPRRKDQDPYAPPPMHHDRSGAVLRFAIIAALLGAAAWGYMTYAGQEQTASLEPVQEQQVADASSYGPPAPSATPVESEPAPQAAPSASPAPRRTTPAPAPAQAVPPPSTTSTPPATPTPIPPLDAPG